MRFHLVSDNEDTLVGMRLAGVDGVLVKEPELAQKAIKFMKKMMWKMKQ